MKKTIYLLLFFFGLCTVAFAQSSLQYEELRVAKIDLIVENLQGTTSFDAKAIRARMQTKVGNLFSQIEFDKDLKFLASEYDRIEPVFQMINNQLYVTIRLWLKPSIHCIEFVGSQRFSRKKLLKELEMAEGDLFDREKFLKGFNKVKTLYTRKGYFESVIGYDIVPIGENQIDLRICIEEGRAGKIQKITITGADACEKDDLFEMIVTKKFNLFFSWLSGSGCYHPDMIEHDRFVIASYFQNKGYADVVVNIYTRETGKKDRIEICITVDKGTCYTIGDICLTGNIIFSHEEIYNCFSIYRQGVFSPDETRNTIKAIRDLYGSEGYIDATCDVRLSLREDAPIYDIEIVVEEGAPYCIGMVRVFGNLSTKTKVILHESLLCPGEQFDIRKLEGTERRLVNTGFFKSVNVYAVRSADEGRDGNCYRDVYIEVEEADTGNVGVFFGFSSLDRLFGGIELSEQNFNIAGIPSLLTKGPSALRGGGEYFHVKTNIGDKQTSYLGQWTKPYFLDTDWIIGFDVEKANNRALSAGYEIKTYGGNVHAIYIYNQFLKHDIFYRARHTDVSVQDTNNPSLLRLAQNTGFISAVGSALIYDSTDSPRKPRHGFRSRLGYEVAGLGGNFQFMKFSYINTLYYPISKKGTFKFRADAQFISTYYHTTKDTLPLSELLYLGGETTVRGYRPFSIGPQIGPHEPRGGLSSYLLSEEYQHNLLKSPCLDAFVFCDAGYVSFSEFTIGQPAASVGFGIRVELMRNVPMTFGFGWPIHPNAKVPRPNGGGTITVDNTQRFFFSMGACF